MPQRHRPICFWAADFAAFAYALAIWCSAMGLKLE
jgi:hypothetical protein